MAKPIVFKQLQINSSKNTTQTTKSLISYIEKFQVFILFILAKKLGTNKFTGTKVVKEKDYKSYV